MSGVPQEISYRKGDLIIFEQDAPCSRHPIEILKICAGMVVIEDGIVEWLSPREFQDRRPAIVGHVEKRWWGKKRVLK